MNVEPQSGPCPHLIAVFLTVTGRALHAGLLLPEPDDPLSPTIVHFQGHLDLREEYAQPNVQWFRPDIPRNVAQLARSRALLLAEAAEHNQIPFSFGFSGLEIDDHGRTALPCGAGFTCASFILAVFESVGAPLVDLETWSNPAPERRAEDEQAQRRFIDSIAVEDAPHASRMEADIGAPRVRPEEVAAASTMRPHPVVFLDAEPVGRQMIIVTLSDGAPRGGSHGR